jgi:hypothetical protein
MAFLNDILIYCNNLKEHKEHILAVMTSLNEAVLNLKVQKFYINREDITYVGIIVQVNIIRMDPGKVQTVQNWEEPEKLKNV